MAFIIEKSVEVNKVIKDSDTVLSTGEEVITMEVTIDHVQVNSDNSAMAFYSINGSSNNYVTFTYSGGDCLQLGETAVEEFINGN